MDIPPFPSEDLAKLVLGYLAEEQLMTAYDEFLNASPFLDAMKNEYDRIFMTSLRTILADYRAVKIFIEHCKPLSLRKRLFHCQNLLDVIKFLINHVDQNKLNFQDKSDVVSLPIEDTVVSQKSNISCEMCSSLRLTMCACDRSSKEPCAGKFSEDKSVSFVETTLLADLPGSYASTHNKVAENQANKSQSSMIATNNIDLINKQDAAGSLAHCSAYTAQNHMASSSIDIASVKTTSSINLACQDTGQSLRYSRQESKRNKFTGSTKLIRSNEVSAASNFQDFSSGVAGGIQNIPDSSTTENIINQEPITIDDTSPERDPRNIKASQKLHISLKKKRPSVAEVAACNSGTSSVDSNGSTGGIINLKPTEQKITVLSDIRMEQKQSGAYEMPKLLRNATSTPLMQMQTIFINGTPAYKHKPTNPPNVNYTNDEIMAMPTIILVPSAGAANVSSITQNQLITESNIITGSNQAYSLDPLTIDVKSPQIDRGSFANNGPPLDLPRILSDPDVVRTESVSMPKDNLVQCSNTPQVLPVSRKSSSTPRRTTHVRVLDFATPRRILDETNLENVNENFVNPSKEVIVSRSPHVTFTESVTDTINVNQSQDEKKLPNIKFELKKDNICQVNKSRNWDADLRAHLSGQTIDKTPEKSKLQKDNESSKKKRKTDKSYSKKNKVKKEDKNLKHSSETTKKSKSDKQKPTNKKDETAEIAKEVPVRPTINIVPADDWSNSLKECDKKNKQQETKIDTPESERIALQNAIGVKLNISDFLETPYKQALYDIQMDTPKFLGTDMLVSGTPISDIKIMNIPTFPFTESPNINSKPTPSSYASRPTDYSSGGSYYKPDDQDYTPILEKYEDIPKYSSNESEMALSEYQKQPKNKVKPKYQKSSRPVRQCTKNISYVNSPPVKSKDNEINRSPCSDKISVSSKQDIKECNISTSEVDNEISFDLKSQQKRRKSSCKKNVHKKRTPIKKELIKIKSRPTLSKKMAEIKRRFSGLCPGSLKTPKRKSTTKEKHSCTASLTIPAPTKSRRKSSTPRKLHCTKELNSDIISYTESTKNINVPSSVKDSDSEQITLRWSDDGSQDTNPSDAKVGLNENDDISNIKDYLNNELNKPNPTQNVDTVDSTKTFDSETAKTIEKDLLDTPPRCNENFIKIEHRDPEKKTNHAQKSASISNVTNVTKPCEEIHESEDIDEIEFSVHDCDDDSYNYLHCEYDAGSKSIVETVKLKEKFTMEVCIDDGVAIRLRATDYLSLFDNESQDHKEIEEAVQSISNIDRLYTPMKDDAIKAQCYDIFDSTLTSLDTPLKLGNHEPSKTDTETTVTEIILEVEQITERKIEIKTKRKRVQSGSGSDDLPTGENKRVKKDAQFLINAASIQNMDIESVLSQLHGP